MNYEVSTEVFFSCHLFRYFSLDVKDEKTLNNIFCLHLVLLNLDQTILLYYVDPDPRENNE